CPLCQFNLDSQQRYAGTKIPVLYLTQLMGLAIGVRTENLGLSMPFVEPRSLLKEKGFL
ncbi:MAG: heterodisulfide reductase subunit B, partial [Deltaproteobacteria bacterium]